MNISLVVLDIGFVTNRTELIIIHHFCVGNLWNRCSNFRELALRPADGTMRSVEIRSRLLLERRDPMRQSWSRSAARNGIKKNERDQPEYRCAADV
jgi:hypothetical protein